MIEKGPHLASIADGYSNQSRILSALRYRFINKLYTGKQAKQRHTYIRVDTTPCAHTRKQCVARVGESFL